MHSFGHLRVGTAVLIEEPVALLANNKRSAWIATIDHSMAERARYEPATPSCIREQLSPWNAAQDGTHTSTVVVAAVARILKVHVGPVFCAMNRAVPNHWTARQGGSRDIV